MKRVKFVLQVLLGVLFVGAGVNHFLNPGFYLKIMPAYIPMHGLMVSLSGITEIIAGVMLLVPALTRWGAWLIIGHLLIFFTVHIWMLQRANDLYKDVPVAALWGRLLFQFVFLAWAYWYTQPETFDAGGPGDPGETD